MAHRFFKDPDAVLDYTLDWQDADDPYLETGETISTSTFIVPAGITKDSESNDGTTATVFLSGGTAGVVYIIVNRITTSNARTDDRSIRIKITER